MYAATATEPGRSTKPNEDWVGVSPTVAVLLDGLSSVPDSATGCIHGTPWYVQQLGSRLLVNAGDPSCELKQALSAAIEQVAALHAACDLAHPGAPSTTVAVLRSTMNPDVVEYLVLADARVVLETDSHEIQVITDDRVDNVAVAARDVALKEPIGSSAQRRAVADLIAAQWPLRNQRDGYWIAASNPGVVEHAITGSLPSAALVRAALFSDGASRFVDVFQQATWLETLALLEYQGPRQLLREVRAVEAADPEGRRWPRYKASDDATVLYLRWRPDAATGNT